MSLRNKKILITCGPTWVPIDDTRVISNISSGELSQTMAQDLARTGAKVTLLEGAVVNPLKSKTIKILKFCYYDELSKLIKSELKKPYDIVIHAAAVSDYKPKKRFSTKIDSHKKNLNLELIPTTKIIANIKKINPKVLLVGFKLESHLFTKTIAPKIHTLFTQSKCDLVLVNSLAANRYVGYIYDPMGQVLASAKSRKSISISLVKILAQ